MELHPIWTIHTISLSRPLFLRTPVVSQRSQYYWLILDSKTGFLRVYEFISIDKELHVKRTIQWSSIPLANCFRIGHNFTVNRFRMLKSFVSHTKNRSNLVITILSEPKSIQHYKPQARPKFSISMKAFALLLCYTSWQSYKSFLEQFPLPPLSLSKQIKSAFIDLLSCKTVRERSWVRRLCTSCRWNIFAKVNIFTVAILSNEMRKGPCIRE